MVHEIMTRVSLETFRERSAGKKVVLLYPWTSYRMLFLTHFVTNNPSGLLYYRIEANQHSLSAWLKGMVDEFEKSLGDFGHQLKGILKNGKPAALGEALAADLGAYRKKREQIILFIDELDRLPFDDDFQEFIPALVNALPKNVQIAISSRLLTYQPWYDLVANGDAVVLGTEYRKDDVMFAPQEMPKPQLEVYALGEVMRW